MARSGATDGLLKLDLELHLRVNTRKFQIYQDLKHSKTSDDLEGSYLRQTASNKNLTQYALQKMELTNFTQGLLKVWSADLAPVCKLQESTTFSTSLSTMLSSATLFFHSKRLLIKEVGLIYSSPIFFSIMKW